jgi:hypothetical protein
VILGPPETKKYSTGFRLFVGGFALIGVGVVLSSILWKPLIAIAFLGIPGLWFKYPNDWRKTWPKDFPRVSRMVERVVGRTRH